MKLTPDQTAGWRRILALLEEIARPSASDLLYQELCRALGNGLFEATQRVVARDWIAGHLRPAKRPYRLGVYALKHAFEWDGREIGRYIRRRRLRQIAHSRRNSSERRPRVCD